MNRIILKAQQMTLQQFKDIKKPHKNKRYRKVFFQCELREFDNGDAVYGLVAYGGYKKKGKICGPPHRLIDMPGAPDTIIQDFPLAFGNMEFRIHPLKKTKGKVYKKMLVMLKEEKENLRNIMVSLEPGIFQNPHVEYSITLDNTTERLNPCPPTPPSDF